MAGEKIFQARAELKRMAKANLLKMAFCQKEKKRLLGGTCPFLLEYQHILFCVSETLGHGCLVEKLRLLSNENAQSEDESPQKAVKLTVGPCLPGLG
jgi:hypothetical protein